MVGIRADANSVIASGHMMRCITIARALVELGEKVTFFMADQESYKLFEGIVSKEPLEVEGVVLGSDYQNMESELETLKCEIAKRNISVLLVDSYAVTYDYFDELSRVCRVAYLDDLHKEDYPVDMVINYSGYSKKMGYEQGYRLMSGHDKEPTKLFLGLKYAPLRKQFYDPEADMAIDYSFAGKEGIHILVSTGGADMCGMLQLLIEMAVNTSWQEKVIWHFVVGGLTEGNEKWTTLVGGHDNIVIHRSVLNMAYLMKRCDLGIMAGGTMLTECASCGLPTVFYQVAENQKYNVEYWGKVSGMSFAGDVSQETPGKDKVISVIKERIERHLREKEALGAMSEELKKITDGRGALEIARVLMGKE